MYMIFKQTNAINFEFGNKINFSNVKSFSFDFLFVVKKETLFLLIHSYHRVGGNTELPSKFHFLREIFHIIYLVISCNNGSWYFFTFQMIGIFKSNFYLLLLQKKNYINIICYFADIRANWKK